jgi:glycosyltransferase involved in cell wall biosynthesis
MRPIKILRVVIGLNQGGVQQGVLNLFRGLDPNRFEPIACAIENTGAIGSEIVKAGFEVIVLGYKRQPWRTILALAKLMREKRVDIVHASSYHPSLYARIAGLLAGVPILMSYEHVVFDRRRKGREYLNRLLQPRTNAFTAVGNAVAEQVKTWYDYPQDKVHVIHNGVDIERFRPPVDRRAAKQALGLDPDRPVVSMICRLDEEKGHVFLFQAIKAISVALDIQWLVVGAGRGEAKIKSQADALGVASRLQFLGLRRDIPEILAATDIYAFPTLQEGFPNSLLEAMSSGCAVVASDFPGNLEVASHERNALIVPMRDGTALSLAISRLLDDQVLADKLGHQARVDIEENFSLAAYACKMSALYESLWRRQQQ